MRGGNLTVFGQNHGEINCREVDGKLQDNPPSFFLTKTIFVTTISMCKLYKIR
jgi:hypothetical protein